MKFKKLEVGGWKLEKEGTVMNGLFFVKQKWASLVRIKYYHELFKSYKFLYNIIATKKDLHKISRFYIFFKKI